MLGSSLLSVFGCRSTWLRFPLLPFLLGFFCWGLLLLWFRFLGVISRFLLLWGCRVSAAHCSIVCVWISVLSEAIVGLVGCDEVLCYLEKGGKPT